MNFLEECQQAIVELEHHPEYSKFSCAFNRYEKIIVIGNGGSNAIASHMSQDFVKFHKKKSLSFSDPSMLTCFINDFGMENAYVKFLEAYVDHETLVILISSSGNSQNIVNCVEYCEKENIPYGILTAFDKDNKMRSTAIVPQFNYYLNSHSYGVVECIHQIFLHRIIGS